MVTTKHCCYGMCRSDSRYSHREHMKGVFFIRFPQPHAEPVKCQKWVQLCRRENFTVSKVTKDTYICSLHFVGGNGPTELHPNPIPATATPKEVVKLSRKRKAPTPRDERVPGVQKKRLKFDETQAAETLLCLSANDRNAAIAPAPSTENNSLKQPLSDTTNTLTTENRPTEHSVTEKSKNTEPSPAAKSSATNPSSSPCSQSHSKSEPDCHAKNEHLNLKIKNILLQNEIVNLKLKMQSSSDERFFSVEDVKHDDVKCKFYTGLKWPQFMHLWEFLGPSKNKLSYIHQPLKTGEMSPNKRPGPKRKLDPINELLLALVRLRTGLLTSDLAYRFGVCESTVSKIVTTWIQYLYVSFLPLRDMMFSSRHIVAENLPSSFKGFKGMRVIIDCSEFQAQQATNFQQQGNMYSSYKGHGTYKVLIGIIPTGAICYVSDAFEGSISDVEIVKQSGFLDKLERGDLIMADRGFTIRDILAERGVDLNIPPFLKGRSKLTPEEEIVTKQIARVRIHVERAIERIKKFRLLKKVIPLSLQPIFSQMVFVAACLVNYQERIVSK